AIGPRSSPRCAMNCDCWQARGKIRNPKSWSVFNPHSAFRNPQFTMTLHQAFEIAFQHHQSGRLAEAEAIYQQILAVEPHHANALHLLGVIAHQVGRNDIAVDLIRKAIAITATVPDFHTNLGETYRALGKMEDAIAAYRQAIALAPNSPEA